MTTTTARLEALEAEAFRSQGHQAHVVARLDHITNALGDLQDGRAVTFDVREIKTELTDHGARLERIESTLASHGETLSSHGELLRAILARLGGKPEQGSAD